MKSMVIRFTAAGIAACGMCLCAEAAGAKTNAVKKASATVAEAKIDDAAKAAAEAKVAAEKGGAEAQLRYAEMLRDGRGVAKNMREAAEWTRKAADGGLAAAQCQMGLFYMNGLGVGRDEDKAVEWLKKAAAQNHAQAQYNLGKLYSNPNHRALSSHLLPIFLSILSIIIAFVTLMITYREFYWAVRKNVYDLKVKDIQKINRPLCRLIKKNLYLDEMCEKCLEAGGWRQCSPRILNFMNASAYENLIHDLIDILDGEALNVLVFSSETRNEMRNLITHIEELAGLIVIVVDPTIFKPKEIRNRISHIKKGWLQLAKLFAKDLMLSTKETREFCDATIGYVNNIMV